MFLFSFNISLNAWFPSHHGKINQINTWINQLKKYYFMFSHTKIISLEVYISRKWKLQLISVKQYQIIQYHMEKRLYFKSAQLNWFIFNFDHMNFGIINFFFHIVWGRNRYVLSCLRSAKKSVLTYQI